MLSGFDQSNYLFVVSNSPVFSSDESSVDLYQLLSEFGDVLNFFSSASVGSHVLNVLGDSSLDLFESFDLSGVSGLNNLVLVNQFFDSVLFVDVVDNLLGEKDLLSFDWSSSNIDKLNDLKSSMNTSDLNHSLDSSSVDSSDDSSDSASSQVPNSVMVVSDNSDTS